MKEDTVTSITMKKTIQNIVFITLLGVAGNGVSQELDDQAFSELLSLDISDLTNLVVSVASKRDEKIGEAPSVISMVTAKEIKAFGAKNLKDVLARVTSIQGFGSHFYPHVVSMRGQTLKHSNNEILFLVNGRPFRTSWNGGTNYPLLLSFPVDMVESLEIIRGPGSVLYGSGAFSGVININTKKSKALTDSQIALKYGSFNTRGVVAAAGTQTAAVEVVAGINVSRTDGWRFSAIDEQNVNDSVDMAEDNTGAIAVLNSGGFTITTVYTESDVDHMGAGVRWPTSSQQVSHALVDLAYQHDLSSMWNVSYNLTYNHFDIDASDSGKRYSRDLLFEPMLQGALSDTLDVLIGGVYENQNGSVAENGGDYDSNHSSFYSQLDYRPWERIKFTAGFQRNKVKGMDADVSPRLGMVADLGKGWGGKLLYGKAFRSAYGTEKFVNGPRIFGTPKLLPETIATWDAQLFYQTPHLYIATTYFHSQIEDLIGRIPNGGGTFTFANSGKANFEGLELEGCYNVDEHWALHGSATYQQSDDNSNVDDVSLSPNVMAKLGLSYQTNSGHSFAAFNSYFGEPADISQHNPGVAQVNPKAEAYNLLTLNASLNLNRLLGKSNGSNMSLELYVDNALNEAIYYPEFNRKRINAIPVYSGRAYYATFKLAF